jgi:DNA-binding NtrC family response regulator
MSKDNLNESDNATADARASGSKPPGKPLPPLVIPAIDDDPGMLRFYKAALANEEVRVESSTDPFHGVDLVETLNRDLILLDLTMPGIDGMEALERIRLRDPEVRVVMITGDYSIESAVRAIQAGATDYICKPISPEKARKIVLEAREHMAL